LQVVLSLLVDTAQVDKLGKLVLSAQSRTKDGDKFGEFVGREVVVGLV
jgi:hypothetical protein